METLETPPRKLPTYLECHMDNIFYKIVEPMSLIVRKMDFTPNGLTTISSLFGILSVYFLHQYKINYFITCFIGYYIFDVLDGYYARRYKMCSTIGDYYDHIKDTLIIVTIIIIIVSNLYHNKNYYMMVSIFISLMLFKTVMSCQELYVKEKNIINKQNCCHSDTLGILKLCKNHSFLNYIRFFGMGFFIVFLCICAKYCEIVKK